MTKTEKVLIAIILVSIGIIAYLCLRPTPAPPPDLKQEQFNEFKDSVSKVLEQRDLTISSLEESLKLIDSNKVKSKEVFRKRKEVARGADEMELDSIIKSYAK